MPIRYTPAQLRDALGLSKETFRYWKRELPALANGRDQRPRFGPGDLLATAIVRKLTDTADLPVSRLAPAAADLFAVCRTRAWPQLERMSVVLLLETDEVRLLPSEADFPIPGLALVLPLRSIIATLREHLHEAEVFEEQGTLAFPPVPVSPGAVR